MEFCAINGSRAPQLYRDGLHRSVISSLPRTLGWLVSALWQSLVCFYVPILSLAQGSVGSDGQILGLSAVSISVSCALVLTSNVRILFECSYQTCSMYVSTFGSVLLWFGVSVLSSYSPGRYR